MLIIPAIDLLGGKAVRLREGKRDDKTVFSHEPWNLVARFAEAGATRIHVVDLDGAFAGARAHGDTVSRIIEASPVPIQVGGGIRDRAALEAVFEAGAERAVLGTAAVKNPEMAAAACRDFPGRIVVAVDARNGEVAVEGWVEGAGITARDLSIKAAEWGAAAVLYTDVARDGMGSGPNVEATAALAKELAGTETSVIASGGVGSLDHVRALAKANIESVVVGRALYDEAFTLAEAIAEAAC